MLGVRLGRTDSTCLVDFSYGCNFLFILLPSLVYDMWPKTQIRASWSKCTEDIWSIKKFRWLLSIIGATYKNIRGIQRVLISGQDFLAWNAPPVILLTSVDTHVNQTFLLQIVRS